MFIGRFLPKIKYQDMHMSARLGPASCRQPRASDPFHKTTCIFMASAQPPKLTKKQKKGIAFRERKKGKPDKARYDQFVGEDGGQDVPIQEAVDQAEIQGNHVEMEKVADAKKCQESTVKKNRNRMGKCKAEDVPAPGDTKVVGKSKKRKREEGETNEGEKSTQKKMKKDDDAKAEGRENTKSQAKPKFILFVGMSSEFPFRLMLNLRLRQP